MLICNVLVNPISMSFPQQSNIMIALIMVLSNIEGTPLNISYYQLAVYYNVALSDSYT